VRIVTPPGVFHPISDTWLLAGALGALPLGPGARVLDLCTGSGAVAVAAAAAHPAAEVSAVDLSRRAVWTARANARLNRVRVRALRGDLFAPVAGERFDAVSANPPYVPSDLAALPRRGLARAWEAGWTGRALLDRIAAEVPAHLRPGGVVLLVQSTVNGVDATLRTLEGGGLAADVVARRRGPLGPLLTARAAMLEARGLLAPGRREEDLVVVRGRRPGAPAR
jgi:release factor glutamine methyltransferase